MEASHNIRYHYNTPEQIKSGRPEKERSLQDLITVLLDCYENYKALSAITQLAGLKAMYKNWADVRADYAYILYSNLDVCNEAFVDQTGNVIGLINTAWSNNEVATIYGTVPIFPATIASELEAIKKYDTYLRNHIPIIPHLRILTNQKKALKQAVKFLSESIYLC